MPSLPESARELLRRKVYAHVVTTNRDGTPQVTMVWVDEEDGDLVFNTALGRLKTRNIERDPRVVVSVQDDQDPQQYLLVHGAATVTTDGADEQIDRLAKKFMDVDSYPYRDAQQQRVKVRVAASRLGGAGPWVDGS